MRKRNVVIVSVLIAVTAAVVTIVLLSIRPEQLMQAVSSSDTSILNRQALGELASESASSASVSRIDKAVIPPANSWISGMVLQDKPLAVFPMPLSVQAIDTGVSIGLPTVTSSATTITGGHTPGIQATIEGATTFSLTRFDKTSATLTYKENDTALGALTITQGSPYVFYRATQETEMTIPNASGGSKTDDAYRFTVGNKQYVLSPHNGATLSVNGATVQVTVPKNGLLTFYVLPATGDDTLLEKFAGNEIKSVGVTHTVSGNDSLTTFAYETTNGKPTLIGMLPYQTVKDGEKLSMTYQTIYGDMQVYQGNSVTVAAPIVAVSSKLPLDDITTEEKAKLVDDLNADSQKLTIEPQDTYFAGKQLARIANLLTLAKQLGEEELSQKFQTALHSELTKRLGKDYFYYDTTLKGVAAYTKAFGSEDFNDHHFHYAYFIYAASVLAEYDAEFLKEYKDQVNLLVADIASYETYDEFSIQRYYDPYSAHSWAAGLAPFQDGNNQESSSEAINAWNAVALWAQRIGNKTLEQNGEWMLANETATASKAWRNVDTSASYLKAYTSPVTSLNFGGKRTYSTFFSDESNTKLAIQLLPFTPPMQVFKSDGDAITKKLAAQQQAGNFNVALGDYLIMYQALADKEKALQALAKQQDTFIDDGNSRAYIRAWIYAQ